MASEIMGVFENVDTAELALTRLRELDVPLISYRIRPFYSGGRRTETGFSAFGAFPAASAGVGLGSAYMAVPFVVAAPAEPTWREEGSEEVVLHLLVDEYNARRARSSLISSHGRQVSER